MAMHMAQLFEGMRLQGVGGAGTSPLVMPSGGGVAAPGHGEEGEWSGDDEDGEEEEGPMGDQDEWSGEEDDEEEGDDEEVPLPVVPGAKRPSAQALPPPVG